MKIVCRQILPYLQPLFVRHHAGQVPHPYATSVVIIDLSSQDHPNTMLFADKNKTKLIYKNQRVQILIQHSFCFLYLMQKRYDMF